MKLRHNLILLILSVFSIASIAQSVEIQGEAKVSQMSTDNNADDIVVRKSDGTLATRSAQSLPSSFEDTIRSLNTDFELAKHICECGADLPPFLVQSLLDAGYTPEDLKDAGVPIANLLTAGPDVYDIDGNGYEQIVIGTQTWLKTGLRVTKYNDGSSIPFGDSNSDWIQYSNDQEPAYSNVNGDPSLTEQHGFIYNSFTVLGSYNGNKEVCPSGWKTPSGTDFTTLRTFLDPANSSNNNSAGASLKQVGLDNWNSPNIGANNLTGFTGLASGHRWGNTGNYVRFGTNNYMLTTTTNGPTANRLYVLENDKVSLEQTNLSLIFGSGIIRCLKN